MLVYRRVNKAITWTQWNLATGNITCNNMSIKVKDKLTNNEVAICGK